MKKLALMAAVLALFAPIAFAQQSSQNNLMTVCNKDATGKKGDERKAFMKTCLSDGKKRQNELMKSCNVEAKGKKGDERKKFMSACLKK